MAVSQFPDWEIREVMADIMYAANSRAKVTTAAIIWLSVMEETNSPTAMQARPNR